MERFSRLNDNSRVWIYTSPRVLSDDEVQMIRKELDIFTDNWAAHGSQLKAKGDVLENRYIVIAADESQTGASGCSIDTSVQFIRALGQELNLDLFNRMYFFSEEGTKIHFSDLADANVKVFNSLAANLGRLRSDWLVEAKELVVL